MIFKSSRCIFSISANSLNTLIEKFKEDNLKIKVEKNYFKIEFNSQEEVDKISSYFNIQ